MNVNAQAQALAPLAYTPTFWNGHREADVARAFDLDTEAARDFKAAARSYYRHFNDGDKFHHAKFERLCRVAGMVRPGYLRTDAETLDDLIEALLDRALATA